MWSLPVLTVSACVFIRVLELRKDLEVKPVKGLQREALFETVNIKLEKHLEACYSRVMKCALNTQW